MIQFGKRSLRVIFDSPKLYSSFTQGAIPNSVVAYGSYRFEYRTSEKFLEGKVNVRYRHTLVVDLWVIKFRLDWLGKWRDEER